MNTKQLKKQLILNIPYIILGLLATNLGEAWRIAAGANASEKVQSLVLDGVFATAFSNPLPSLYPGDLLVGIACGAALRLAVYLKGKNAKKFRHNEEYGKTAKSILVSCGARLAPFDIKELRDLTAYDELELDTLGDEKTALFLIMSDTDGTFNFLISMIYTQMFNLLCEKADDVYGGRLPVHVRCLIDEAANIGQIPNLEKLVATIRSREISACLVLQAKSQLKAIYKDNADTIIGNMDSQIFLGGTEQTTLKDLNAILGKETIDMYNTGQSKGSQESYNMNYQKLGKDLMTMDELAVMDGSKCIVQVRGVRPFLSDKYDLTQHPNYKLTADYDKRNYFDVVKFLSHNLILKADDEYQVIDVTE